MIECENLCDILNRENVLSEYENQNKITKPSLGRSEGTSFKATRIAENSNTSNPKRRSMQNLFNDTPKVKQWLKIALNGFCQDSEKQELIKWFNDNFQLLDRTKDISLIQFTDILSSGKSREVKNATVKAENLDNFYNHINNGIKSTSGIVLDSYLTKIEILKNFNKSL